MIYIHSPPIGQYQEHIQNPPPTKQGKFIYALLTVFVSKTAVSIDTLREKPIAVKQNHKRLRELQTSTFEIKVLKEGSFELKEKEKLTQESEEL